MRNNSNQIFISHSSKDTKLINLITLSFKGPDIVPFFARQVMMGKNPVEKIINAINNSMALFAVITSNVVHDPHTRDWVVFEIAVAKIRGIPIFCWIDDGVAKNRTYPKLIENITDYDTFNHVYDEQCYRAVGAMVDKAFELKGKPQKVVQPTRRELKEGLTEMEEAKKIAVGFVGKRRKFDSIKVDSIEPKGDGWIVEGSIYKSTRHGGGSTRWKVEIRRGEVLSYKFKPGKGWAIL